MANYSAPGVYIEEISTLGSSVAAVPTAVPGFVGFTEKSLINGVQSTFPSPPVRITSMLEYEQIFGGPKYEAFTIALSGENPGVANIAVAGTITNYILYYQMQMFFANGGGTCYVVSAGDYGDAISDTALNLGVDKFEQVDEVTLLLAPEAVFTAANMKNVYNRMLLQCNTLKDRFVLMDALHGAGATVAADATAFRSSGVGADYLKYGASYYPSLNTSIQYAYSNADVNITDSRTGTGGAPYSGKTLAVIQNGQLAPAIAPDKSLYNSIIAELAKRKLVMYPSASMAGVCARVDADRGVWKAPANVGLFMVLAPSVLVTETEQNGLNIDSVSGKSINAIRQFSGRGTLVWGARTLAGNDNEWRYVNVRRLFTFVEESIKKATEFVVFEPNTASTWQRVISMSEAFLTGLWRDGAMAGATTKDAFFVRVGLGSTMTADDILNGRMIVEIGLAAARPAEFIILRFSHKLQES